MPILHVLRLLTNTGDDAAFRLVVTDARPAFSAHLLDKIATESMRAGTSLLAAARSLLVASSVLRTGTPSMSTLGGAGLGGGGLCCGSLSLRSPIPSTVPHSSALPAIVLDNESRNVVHSLLRRVEDLVQQVRMLPPSSLVAAIIKSGIVGSLNPNHPPHGAKLLANELSAALACRGGGDSSHLQLETASMPPRYANALGGCSQASHTLTPAGTPVSGRLMAPPPGAHDQLARLKSFLEHHAMSELEQGGDGKEVGGGVHLSTIHGAKGREWPVVILPRVNEDTLPLASFADEEGVSNPEQARTAHPQ